MKELARTLYFWPRMNASIDDRVFNCDDCAKLQPSKPMETLRTTTASYPREHASSDLATFEGKKLFIYADQYSGWLLVAEMKSSMADHVIAVLERWFSKYGICKYIRTDGGPPYNSAAFAEFCKKMESSTRCHPPATLGTTATPNPTTRSSNESWKNAATKQRS